MKVFVDTDICLDLLTGRKPFNANAEKLFSLSQMGKIEICVSSLSFAVIDYLLQSTYKRTDSRAILLTFKSLVNVLPVDDKIITLALASEMKDFEDAIQHFTALENQITILLTRNIKDYEKALVTIVDTKSFLSGWLNE